MLYSEGTPDRDSDREQSKHSGGLPRVCVFFGSLIFSHDSGIAGPGEGATL